jgi:hypothetical protein
MTALNSVMLHRANQAPRLSNQDIMSCSLAVSTNGSSCRRSYSSPAGERIRIGLVPTLPRPRSHSVSNSPAHVGDSLNIGFL